jgi:hypothetical protein
MISAGLGKSKVKTADRTGAAADLKRIGTGASTTYAGVAEKQGQARPVRDQRRQDRGGGSWPRNLAKTENRRQLKSERKIKTLMARKKKSEQDLVRNSQPQGWKSKREKNETLPLTMRDEISERKTSRASKRI